MARPADKSGSDRLPVAVGLFAAAAGATAYILASKYKTGVKGTSISDAPAWTLLKAKDADHPIAAKTLLINRSRDDLYASWKAFTRFSEFMENVEAIEPGEGDSSRWTIKAPAGRTVTLLTRIREDLPGEKIAWESTPESEIATKGQVEFADAGERGTYVSLVMSYAPPGGTAGQIAAKLFGREPGIQARHDLKRFKQLMETGEVTTNASPSARKGESPTEARF